MKNLHDNLFEDLDKTQTLFVDKGAWQNLSTAAKAVKNGNLNRVRTEDSSVHDWYRFVLSFPPHLVREYLTKFGITKQHTVLDPFCGTGTTLVECKKLGIQSVGVEGNPMAHFASRVKVNWSASPKELSTHAKRVAVDVTASLE